MDANEQHTKFDKLLYKLRNKYKMYPSPELKKKILKLKKLIAKNSSTTDKSSVFPNIIQKVPQSALKASICPVMPENNVSETEFNQFSDVGLSPPILKALDNMGLKTMTTIQRKAIPLGLNKNDILASAKTGSGKTLAFLVPLVEKLCKSDILISDAVQALIISPTKELTVQTYGVLKSLAQFTRLKVGLVTSGGSRTSEYDHEVRGAQVLVATAGRLLDHLRNSEHFSLSQVKFLVLDEADMLLDQGNGDDVRKILRVLPSSRQSLLFSATASPKTRKLAGTALHRQCECVAVDEIAPMATVSSLQQGFIVCPPDRRFSCLYAFLARNKRRKIMVFMTARMEVKFYADVLHLVGFPVYAIYGTMTQLQRRTAMQKFTESESSVLLCTSIAARGLDIPQVDWILQYDPPDDPKEYIHRVGRTARAGASGNALLLLRPHELEFLEVLKQAKVEVAELEFNFSLVGDSQNILLNLVTNDPSLRKTGVQAFSALVRGYASSPYHGNRDVEELDLPALARGFGLDSVPRVNLPGDKEASWAKLVSASGRGRTRRKSKF